ncbi:MAG: N-acetyl-1-D-myo-inositol-2-amino-2-deoxy-alpha-D-glucopyranoside deacetylase [Pseudonocardia sp.]|nr:N-acetyl-1-D-myo-inositol-2-amino-2-deoxy-alpha-D-glucopyranoside deacetylase [Pseudonocardia sp.]
MTNSRRLLLVHAHPDDEAIATGATIARYAAEGVQVCLVTCTRGEYGDVVDGELAWLRDQGPDALGKHREGELAAALAELGVHRHIWLGGPGRWWDSGMAGAPENDDPRAFMRADFADAVREMVAILRRERPAVVITDDDHGSYGHPDHIQAHRVTVAAVDRAGDPAYAAELGEPWQVAKVYWSALPRSWVRQLVADGVFTLEDEMPGVPDEEITARIDGRAYLPTKMAALRAHRSQVDLNNGPFAVVGHAPQFALEHYRLFHGQRGPGKVDPYDWEDDLFAGLTEA